LQQVTVADIGWHDMSESENPLHFDDQGHRRPRCSSVDAAQ
jgi:hypothetical protein